VYGRIRVVERADGEVCIRPGCCSSPCPAMRGSLPGARRWARRLIAGYNRYLGSVGGPDGIRDPRCGGGAWVRPTTPLELWRRAYQISLLASGGQSIGDIVAGQPPAADAVAATVGGHAVSGPAAAAAWKRRLPDPERQARTRSRRGPGRPPTGTVRARSVRDIRRAQSDPATSRSSSGATSSPTPTTPSGWPTPPAADRLLADPRSHRHRAERSNAAGQRPHRSPLAGRDGLPGRRFTASNLRRLWRRDISYGDTLVRTDLAALCRADPIVTLPDGRRWPVPDGWRRRVPAGSALSVGAPDRRRRPRGRPAMQSARTRRTARRPGCPASHGRPSARAPGKPR
jgi:hypothetical protein